MLFGTKFQFPNKLDEKYGFLILIILIASVSLTWLVFFLRMFSLKDPNIVVVSVIGKTNLRNEIPSKIVCINEYFQNTIFENASVTDEVCTKKNIF